MAFTPVEAVVFWRYITSPFKAVYGRFPEGGYTKNYLQTSGVAKTVLDKVLNRPPGEQIEFAWRWPGGSLLADWKEKVVAGDSRGELDIRVGQNTVVPFQLGNPGHEDFATIPGDRGKTTAVGAEAELDALKATGLNPWIVAIKLRGEANILHARAYLQNPTAHL